MRFDYASIVNLACWHDVKKESAATFLEEEKNGTVVIRHSQYAVLCYKITILSKLADFLAHISSLD